MPYFKALPEHLPGKTEENPARISDNTRDIRN